MATVTGRGLAPREAPPVGAPVCLAQLATSDCLVPVVVPSREAAASRGLHCSELPEPCGFLSADGMAGDTWGAGTRGWGLVPVVHVDLSGSGVVVAAEGRPDTLYDTILADTTGAEAAGAGSSMYLRRVVRASPGDTVAVCHGRRAALPYVARRTLAAWRQWGSMWTRPGAAGDGAPPVPVYVFRDAATGYMGLDVDAYAGDLAHAVMPLTPAHVARNSAFVLCCVRAARRDVVVAAAGASAKARNADRLAFSELFPTTPWRDPAVAAAVTATRPWCVDLRRPALVSDAVVASVCVLLNLSPARRPHMYMLETLTAAVPAPAADRRRREPMPLYRLATTRDHVTREPLACWDAPGRLHGRPTPGAPQPSHVHFLQVRCAGGKGGLAVDHYVLVHLVVCVASRHVDAVYYADPFWNDAWVGEEFWARFLADMAARDLVISPATVVANRHTYVHNQTQDAEATRDACGWLCLQGAARALTGAVPDVCTWSGIRRGLLVAATTAKYMRPGAKWPCDEDEDEDCGLF
jgi:hypothetical protein